MTKKDYALIAKALKRANPTTIDRLATVSETIAWLNTIDSVSAALASDNPRFNVATFEKAVGRDGWDYRAANGGA